jgi:SAM-dependent methyltransferase
MSTVAMPSADIVFDTLFGFQRTAALKSGIDLDMFTAIDEGVKTASALAARVGAAERGVRILCDYLVTIDLLTKSGTTYALTTESAAFLSKRSPAYMGTMARFLTLPDIEKNFDNLTDAVRRGGVAPAGNTVSEENPIWIEFAKSMVPMAVPAAHAIADFLKIETMGPIRVLDIAAGHGMYGIVLAQRNPQAEVVAADWGLVLAVAREHARQAGVGARLRTVEGDAFKTDFGGPYDVALVTNFLHHFDPPTCTAFLSKVHAALKPGGRVAVLEFVPNDDRVSPGLPARFSLTMLAGTPSGDAYTFSELARMLDAAGFSGAMAHSMPTPQQVIVASK